MQTLLHKTKGDEKPKGKPRVFFTCHPGDFGDCFHKLCEDLFRSHDCAVYYTKDLSAPPDADDRSLLGEFNLLIVPVTRRLLTEPNRAMDTDIPLALDACVPVLPILMEAGLDELYARPDKFGSLQYLDAGSTDTTQIAYGDKLKKFLDSVLLSREMTDRIRAAFSARIFLSYRKKDRLYANRLMRMIHRQPGCGDMAIWFDEFLTPGESFSDNIAKILANSDLFTLLVTPSILEEPNGKPNFVMGEEYPSARRSGIRILPVQMQKTDPVALAEKFKDLPACVDPYEEKTFSESLSRAVAKLAIRTEATSPVHDFLIGLAYLDGIDMEVDRQKALKLISQAAREQLPEAMEKLILMYTNGDGISRDPAQAAFWSKELALYFYRQCFELTQPEALTQLFSNYRNDYWAEVIRQFLLLADTRLDTAGNTDLWKNITALQIREYSLLFSCAADMTAHRELARQILLAELLERSTDGTYPAYGPLFWYVPEYDLYASVLCCLKDLTEHPAFSKMLALCRDVCWIFGQYHTATQVTEKIDPAALLEKAQLTGVRQALCRLFYLGVGDCSIGQDIYPRCFNPREAQSFFRTGSGVWDRMTVPFEDELGLFTQEMYPLVDGEWVGIVAAPYAPEALEAKLAQADSRKLRGLILSPTQETSMGYLSFNRAHTQVLYVPENTRDLWYRNRWREQLPLIQDAVVLSGKLFYFRENAFLPPELKSIGMETFSGCRCLSSVTVPEGVTELGWEAFEGCKTLRSVTLPDTLQTIGERAFAGCIRLQTIHLGNGLQEIGSHAFYNCFALESVVIPNSVKTIESVAFLSCEKLKHISLGNGLEQIDAYAFSDCAALEELHLPDSIRTLGGKIFSGCSAMKRLTGCPDGYTHAYLGLEDPVQITYRKDSLKTLTVTQNLPEKAHCDDHNLGTVRVATGVDSLGASAFARCVALRSIEAPESLTQIGSRCFSGCSALAQVTFSPMLRELEEGLFSDCIGLSAIALPAQLRAIGENAFRGCTGLGSVTFPQTLQSISRKAFAGCTALTQIRLPDSLEVMEEFVFDGCTGLKLLENCPSGYGAAYLGLDASVQIHYRKESAPPQPLQISAREISAGAYAHRRNISRLVAGNGLAKISDRAFLCCGGLEGFSLPEGITELGRDVFRSCTRLTSAVLPDSVTELGNGAFDGCSRLEKVRLSPGISYLPDGCFRDCTALTQITIPEGVTAIGERAFTGCTALQTISLPQTLESIGKAFENCVSLRAVEIPDSVTFINSRAFLNCTALESVTLPKSLEFTGLGVFEGCSALQSLTIPEGLEQIERLFCMGCTSLAHLQIPESVTRIAFRAFQDCTALETLYIPESVRDLEDNAFRGCTGLKLLTLPARYKDSLPRIFSEIDLSQTELHWL